MSIFLFIISFVVLYLGMISVTRWLVDRLLPLSDACGWSDRTDRTIACTAWPIFLPFYMVRIANEAVPLICKAISWVKDRIKKEKKTPQQVIDENNPTDIVVNLIRQQILLSPEIIKLKKWDSDKEWCHVYFKKKVRDAEVDIEVNHKPTWVRGKSYWGSVTLRVGGVLIGLNGRQSEILTGSLQEGIQLIKDREKAEKEKEKELAACEAVTKLLGLPKPEEDTTPLPMS